MSLDAPAFRPVHANQPKIPDGLHLDPFTSGSLFQELHPAPMSESLSAANLEEFAGQDSAEVAGEVEADKGDGETEGGSGTEYDREGRLVTQRARLRRMVSYPILSPPSERPSSPLPFKSTHSDTLIQSSPFLRRSSHPDVVPHPKPPLHHHAQIRVNHLSRPPASAKEPSSLLTETSGYKRSSQEEWCARGLPSRTGPQSRDRQPGWGMIGVGPRMLPSSFFGARQDGLEKGQENDQVVVDGETTLTRQSARNRKHRAKWDAGSPIFNLPVMPSGTGSATSKTSFPIKNIQADLDIYMRELLSPDVLASILCEENGRDKFKEWIKRHSTSPDALAIFEFYCEAQSYLQSLDKSHSLRKALYETFLALETTRPTALFSTLTEAESSSTAQELQGQQHKASGPVVAASEKALDVLYRDEFAKFLQHKIVAQAQVRLGLFANLTERGDLSDVFCLTNPRLPDHPIVMVSDGFTRLTEYPSKRIIGRNCRFLQGPSTDPKSVQRIRKAVAAGEPCCEILLNYKRSGEPFYNLLSIIPLLAPSGRTDYFLSGQCDISIALASPKALAFLIGVDYPLRPSGTKLDNGPPSDPPPPRSSDQRISESVSQRAAKQTERKSLWTGAEVPTSGVEGTSDRRPSAHPVVTTSSVSPSPRGLSQWYRARKEDIGVYSRVLVVRASPKMEIMYVTTSLLEMLDYPCTMPQQAYNSQLLHGDFTELLALPTRLVTKQLQELVRTAIVEREVAYSTRAGLLHFAKGPRRPGFRNDQGVGISMGLIHLMPLRDAEGIIDCFCVVFGT